ncbi:MAG: selenocysteine-specific translation elongation factor [Verrucomicrobiales bacterium]|nr:selenocysteine-specific translation elongation factor [Verrucomicrobiales bacterium]
MERRNYIVATAGHVDHGKSSLVKALTNTDPDRLPEEKQRGITIDLGFAHLEIPMEDAIADVGLVDVPGHEDFVKNMVTGVGAADAALLVVAADDGWMPQTEEHVQILNYLAVPNLLVALTKVDLPDADPELVEEIIRDELSGTPYSDADIVKTSINDLASIAQVPNKLSSLLTKTSRRQGPPQLWVDRAFSMRGIGTVVTGTLEHGSMETGQSVIIQPRGTPARIRGVQTFGDAVEVAQPGSRVALNLPDIDLSPQSGKPYVQRGDVLTVGESTDIVDVILTKSARQISPKSPANKALKHSARVRIHIGTGNFVAKVILPKAKELCPGETSIAQLRFESPVFCRDGDRFTVRDWTESSTLAGGRVLESVARTDRFREPEQQSLLQKLSGAEVESTEWIAAILERDGFKPRCDNAAEKALLERDEVIKMGSWIINGDWWSGHQDWAVAAIRDRLESDPALPGYPLNDLRLQLRSRLPNEELAQHLINALCESALKIEGELIAPPGHEARLPDRLKAGCERIRTRVAENPRETPSRTQLADSPETERALRYLVDINELVQLDPNTFLPAETCQEMINGVVHLLTEKGSGTMSDIRTTLQTSRRIALPLMEKLDRDGITQRVGDQRQLTEKGRGFN